MKEIKFTDEELNYIEEMLLHYTWEFGNKVSEQLIVKIDDYLKSLENKK